MQTDPILPGARDRSAGREIDTQTDKRRSRLKEFWTLLFGCPACSRLGYKCRDCWYDEAF